MVGFDSERFIKYCDKASPYYDPKIADFNDISRELFQTEEVWVSRDLIIKAMEALAKYHGFTICIEKEAIMCNRNDNEQDLSCICEWRFEDWLYISIQACLAQNREIFATQLGTYEMEVQKEVGQAYKDNFWLFQTWRTVHTK